LTFNTENNKNGIRDFGNTTIVAQKTDVYPWLTKLLHRPKSSTRVYLA